MDAVMSQLRPAEPFTEGRTWRAIVFSGDSPILATQHANGLDPIRTLLAIEDLNSPRLIVRQDIDGEVPLALGDHWFVLSAPGGELVDLAAEHNLTKAQRRTALLLLKIGSTIQIESDFALSYAMQRQQLEERARKNDVDLLVPNRGNGRRH